MWLLVTIILNGNQFVVSSAASPMSDCKNDVAAVLQTVASNPILAGKLTAFCLTPNGAQWPPPPEYVAQCANGLSADGATCWLPKRVEK